MMEYRNTTEPAFHRFVGDATETECLYSIISRYDWHLRLCFRNTYQRTGLKGKTIVKGEIELRTDYSVWFLFDTQDGALVASSMDSGYGDRTRNYFAGRKWILDLAALPNFTLSCDRYRLHVEPYEDEDEEENADEYSCWHIATTTGPDKGAYNVYPNRVEFARW